MMGYQRFLLSNLVFILLFISRAEAQFPYKESFRNSTARGITFGGAPYAFLTASGSSYEGGTPIDPEGDGYLRLTSNAQNQKGYVYSNEEFSSTDGLSVVFEYYIYGGTNADGISLFLFDATANPFTIGGFGGSLGYAQYTKTDPPSPGVSKGYIAIGLDEYGNFSNPIEGRQGGIPGFRPGSVTLRGKGDGASTDPQNYKYLTSILLKDFGFSLTEGDRRYPDSTSSAYRRVYMDLVPNATIGYNVTVRITKGGPTPVTRTVISNYHYMEPAPPRLKYGIASSTGDQTNFHEIRNVTIDAFDVSKLKKPLAKNDTLGTCGGKREVINVGANDKSLSENGSIDQSSIDLNPSLAGVQTSFSITGKGVFSVNADNNVQFVPDPSFINGTVTASYTIKDVFGLESDPASIVIISQHAPGTPNAGADAVVNVSAAAASVTLQGSDPTTNKGRWTVLSGPGTVAFSDATLPNAVAGNLTGGVYVFRWTVSSAGGCSSFDDVSITVNRIPVAIDDSVTTGFNKPVTIPVLLNDKDADGNATILKSSVKIQTAPQHGTVQVDPVTGTVLYQPAQDYSGYDVFTYSISDDRQAESLPATVNIAVNVRPEGSPDIASTVTNSAVGIRVLDNDKGRTGGTVNKGTDPSNGSVSYNTDGSVLYTPASGFSGVDQFTYILKNREGQESLPISVTVNVRPKGTADNTITPVNVPVSIPVKGNDVSKTGTTVVIKTSPEHGAVQVNSDGSVVYSPSQDYTGPDVFTYALKNAEGLESDPISVGVFVNGVPPTVPDIDVNVSADLPIVVRIPPQYPGSVIEITTQPKHGTVTVDPVTGKVTYTPAPGYTGPDEFGYVIRDGYGHVSAPGTAKVVVSRSPRIGMAKALTSNTKNPDGSYNLTFTFTLVNYGDYSIRNLSLTDDLAGAFPSSTVVVRSISASGHLRVNNNYDGVSDKQLLLADSYIDKVSSETVKVEMTVTLNELEGTFFNTAYVEGYGENSQNKTSDQSTNGLTPDPVTAGNPAPSQLTPIKLVKQPLFIPGGFSPNGDGINDFFVIENALGKQLSLEIYNRWGNRVYRSKSYQNDWNGRCTEGIHVGEDVPVGTYYYILTVNNAEKKVGYVTINR